MEQYYVFLKNNRVAQVAVFASQDEILADSVAQEQGCGTETGGSNGLGEAWKWNLLLQEAASRRARGQ